MFINPYEMMVNSLSEKKETELSKFMNSIEILSEEEKEKAIKNWEEKKEKDRLEAIEERRHRELCQAIRESGKKYYWW